MMKIVRLNREDLKMGKDAIRQTKELSAKDKDSIMYRVLVPIVPDSTCLVNLVEAFIESKNNGVNIDSKYSFHCANKEEIDVILKGISNGEINGFKEFKWEAINA